MNSPGPAWISSLWLIVIAIAAVSPPAEAAESKNYLCDHQYALCTSAPCVPQPGDHAKATCFCVVQEGKSLSTEKCDKVKPTTDKYGIRTVYSAFSLNQFVAGMKGMKCPQTAPWTWCLNKRCTVDPFNPEKAICTCDVIRTSTEEWMTVGGDCNTASCATGYWSGATKANLDDAVAFMVKELGLKTSPVQWCPAGGSPEKK